MEIMAENCLFNDVEKHFFSDDYQAVIAIWEKNKKLYTFSFEDDNDRKILKALVVSYNELNRINESIFYINKFIHFFKKQKIKPNEYYDDMDFFYLSKSSIYVKERKIFCGYKTLKEYIHLGGENGDLIKSFHLLDDLLFQSYRRFNLYFVYVFIGVIILNNILKYASQIQINSIFMISFDVVGLLWIGINCLSQSLSKKIYNKLKSILI